MQRLRTLLASGLLLAASGAFGQTDAAVLERARAEKPLLLETLRDLTAIDSGSRDYEGLEKILAVVAARLKDLGGDVEYLEPVERHRSETSPERIGRAVRATFRGKGAKKILLLAHVDTVYAKGQGATQPFRIDGDRAYGLAISDAKGGVALVLHTLRILRDLPFDQYGTITVVFNGDEEVGSVGHRDTIVLLGAESDAVLSFEAGGGSQGNQIRLTTAGLGSAVVRVRGRASHAGSSPHLGVNALYEMAHQVLQMRDLSDPALGTKLNWTIAKAGFNSNVIPFEAEARADVRVLRVEDYDRVEQLVRDRAKNQLLPEAKVEVEFRRGRPPLTATPASVALAKHAQGIFREVGLDLSVSTVSAGGGTDAAYAALRARGAVVEGWGLRGFGGHSANAEYIWLDSIEPRLYLTVRTIMDIARGKVPSE